MTAPSLTWYELADLVPELESLRLAARGMQVSADADHPRWCRELAWAHFHREIKALVGPSSDSQDPKLLRWSSLDVARLVVFLGMPPCPRGCEHRHDLRERAETRELAEVGV